MKKHLLIIIIVLTNLVFAQENKFSTEDIVLNSYTTLAPSSMEQLKWLPNDAEYSYIEHDGKNQILMKGTRSGKKISLVDLEELNSKLVVYEKKSNDRFPKYTWITDSKFVFWIKNILFSYDVRLKEIKKMNEIPTEAEDKSTSFDYKNIAYVLDYNFFVKSGSNDAEQLTHDGSYDFTYGKSVSRNEFGINEGIFWSPSGKKIAFYHEDLRSVTDYPLLKLNTIPAKTELIKYPMAGGKSPKVSLAVYDLEQKKTTWLETIGPEDQYLTSITWAPDEQSIYLGQLNRDQNHLKLYKYSVSSGKQDTLLFEEKNDKYVEPEDGLKFIPNDSEKFIWLSRRDGWKHAYLYTTKGKLIKQLTKGDWEITEFHGFDGAGENIFITSTEAGPDQRQFYRVNIKTVEKNLLTSDAGSHSVDIHSSGFYFIDSYSSLEVPKRVRLINYKGETESILLNSPDPLIGKNIGKTEIFTIKASDNTDLYCRTVFPSDFDATKKYPVIIYVYGGPHAQLITNTWPVGRYSLWFYRMAQEGYIVFTLDNRGSSNRGLEFEQATFRNLGTVEIEDQLKGIEYLTSLPYIDSNRIGVYGWSYGGFMTTSLMLRANNKFKVGVAGGAVIDWNMYEVMYTERYMDTPETNKEGYEKASLLNYVDNLNGKLLLVHGTDDPTVVWQNTLRFAQEAMHKNKKLDYFPYVGHPHGVGGKDAIHLYQKITDYFLENL